MSRVRSGFCCLPTCEGAPRGWEPDPPRREGCLNPVLSSSSGSSCCRSRESRARHGEKFPIITAQAQGELERAERAGVADLAVGPNGPKWVEWTPGRHLLRTLGRHAPDPSPPTGSGARTAPRHARDRGRSRPRCGCSGCTTRLATRLPSSAGYLYRRRSDAMGRALSSLSRRSRHSRRRKRVRSCHLLYPDQSSGRSNGALCRRCSRRLSTA